MEPYKINLDSESNRAIESSAHHDGVDLIDEVAIACDVAEMSTVNARQIIIEETVAIARDAAADWHNAQATIDEAKEVQASANERYQGCHATAGLFKFDLEEEVARAIAREHAAAPNSVADDFRGVILPPIDARPTIRDFALAEAERARPGPVRAATLRQAYKERFGKEVHSKSFGMTLYRLSEDHFVERRGQSDWFFVDEAERKVRRERDQALHVEMLQAIDAAGGGAV